MNIDFTTIYNEMPDFTNHEKAKEWFQGQFGDRFVLKNSDVVEGKKVYYYHVVKNQEAYQEYMEMLSNEETTNITNEPFESYSTIEITEDGGISFSL